MSKDIPLDWDEALISSVGDTRITTTCGYCTQGRHAECRGYSCDCSHEIHKK